MSLPRCWSPALALAMLIPLSGCNDSGAATDPRLAPPRVVTAVVESAQSAPRRFQGIIAARVESDIGFRVAGKITERRVQAGQHVRHGDVLMTLDPQDLTLAMQARRAAVDAAQALTRQAQDDERRARALSEQGAVSIQQRDQAIANARSAEAQWEAARAQLDVARHQSEYAVLRADADGVIVETFADRGQVVGAGTPVLRLALDGAREALVQLPETWRPRIGDSAQVTLYGHGESASSAQLRELSDAADTASRTYSARFVLHGPAAQAPLGASLQLTMDTQPASADARLQIPLGALHDTQQGFSVWVIDQDHATVHQQAVTVSGMDAEHALLTTGPEIGTRIVALGAHLLHENEAVAPFDEQLAWRR